MNININKTIWSNFSEAEMTTYVENVFQHYREKGFPYFNVDRDKEFNKLLSYNGEILQDGVVKQTMHGLALAWSYFPHSWDVRCNNKMTVMEAFSDDDVFRKVIRKRIKMGDNMSDNGIRKMLKMFSGVQSVSNFRPTSASALYERFLPNGGKILDMSSGFGGRLLGAIRANHRVGHISYEGYDPSTPTYNGLISLTNDYAKDMDVKINRTGSENIDLVNDCDFAFTSPPYFDTEKYTDEDTQSYMKYPSRESWLNGFLSETFSNVHRALRRDCFMVINIANVPSYKNLEDETVALAKHCGFDHTDTLKLALSNSTFKKGKSAFKYEPLFVFRKK